MHACAAYPQVLTRGLSGLGPGRAPGHSMTIPETPSPATVQAQYAHGEALRRQAPGVYGAGGPGRHIDNSPSKRAPKSLRVLSDMNGGWDVVACLALYSKRLRPCHWCAL